MSARPGRPRSDRLVLVERVAELLAVEPELNASAVHRRIGGRRTDVLRVVKALRVVSPVQDTKTPQRRFPNPRSGSLT